MARGLVNHLSSKGAEHVASRLGFCIQLRELILRCPVDFHGKKSWHPCCFGWLSLKGDPLPKKETRAPLGQLGIATNLANHMVNAALLGVDIIPLHTLNKGHCMYAVRRWHSLPSRTSRYLPPKHHPEGNSSFRLAPNWRCLKASCPKGE